MSLVHHIGSRASLDLDFSLETEFADIEETRARMERTLLARFSTRGHVPFDVTLTLKPSTPREDLPCGVDTNSGLS